MFSVAFVCLLVASNITQKAVNGLQRNVAGCGVVKGTGD